MVNVCLDGVYMYVTGYGTFEIPTHLFLGWNIQFMAAPSEQNLRAHCCILGIESKRFLF